MDTEKFLEVLGSSSEADASLEHALGVVREQLEGDERHSYYDVNGDGRLYVADGRRHGVGNAVARIEVLDDGRVRVSVDTRASVSFGHERALRKLCALYSSRFKVRGLFVEGGALVFRTAPFDPERGRFSTDVVVGLALSTAHAYAGVPTALEAGVPAWDLMDYDNWGDDSDDADGEGDGGHSEDDALSDDEGLADLLRSRISRLLGEAQNA